jgi:hypothetical protein
MTVAKPRIIASDISTHRSFFDWIAENLSIKCEEDWYNIKYKDISHYGGSELLKQKYNGSPSYALKIIYPEIDWQVFRFHSVPKDYWNYREHRRKYFDWIADMLSISLSEDWYNITYEQIVSLKGRGLLGYYNGSHASALMDIYPETDWQPWRFQRLPKNHFTNSNDNKFANGTKLSDSNDYNHDTSEHQKLLERDRSLVRDESLGWNKRMKRHYWKDLSNMRSYFDWIAEELNVHKVEDWYQIDYRDIVDRGGSTLIDSYYSGSKSDALMNCYVDTDWHPWRFGIVPDDYWNDIDNRRKFFEYLGDKLSLTFDDWYDITRKSIFEQGGGGLLRIYSSPGSALMSAFPEFSWEPWKFQTSVKEHWSIEENRRSYLDYIAEKLQLKGVDDWYEVSPSDFDKLGGYSLVDNRYHGNHSKAIMSIYPDVAWQPWRFVSMARKLDPSRLGDYISWLEDKMGSNAMQWQGITRQFAEDMVGKTFISKFGGSMVKILEKFYPHYSWNAMEWYLNGKSRSQRLLYDMMRKLVKNNVEIEMEYRFLAFKSIANFSLDIWIPGKNLAVEYHGIQHFMDHGFVHLDVGLGTQKKRDRYRKEACTFMNIHLMEIPFWWTLNDLAISSLLRKVKSPLLGMKIIHSKLY